MLYINDEAQCPECKNNLRCFQPKGNEIGEQWICDKYKDGAPEDVTVLANDCPKFEKKGT